MDETLRYFSVKRAIRDNELKNFGQIFSHHLPKSSLANKIGRSVEYLNRRIDDPGILTIADLYKIAEVFDVPPEDMLPVVKPELLKKRSSGSVTVTELYEIAQLVNIPPETLFRQLKPDLRKEKEKSGNLG